MALQVSTALLDNGFHDRSIADELHIPIYRVEPRDASDRIASRLNRPRRKRRLSRPLPSPISRPPSRRPSRKTYPGGTIVSAAKMSRGAQVRYELSVKPTADAAPIPLLVSPEGVISTNAKGKAAAGAPPAGRAREGQARARQRRNRFPIVDLPKPVVKAIKDAYPKNEITSALKLTQGSQVPLPSDAERRVERRTDARDGDG
jgi:hypothetical protein